MRYMHKPLAVALTCAGLVAVALNACDSSPRTSPGSGSDSIQPMQGEATRNDEPRDPSTLGPTALAGQPPAPAGTVDVADAAINIQVREALVAEPQLRGATIDVRTTGGIVILHGQAASARAKAIATQVAAAVSGVKHVKNELIVGS